MQQGISIIFPHLVNSENDKILALNKKMLAENTTGKYELLYLAELNKKILPENTTDKYELLYLAGRKDIVYESFNILAKLAQYELILISNTDIVFAPDWDFPIEHIKDKGDWISLRVVECGAIPSASTMISKKFGMTADTFNRDGFENFVKKDILNRPVYETGWIWYCPSIFKKSKFLELGGFDNTLPFPHPNDIEFKNKATKAGWQFIISNHSYAYHFQRGHIHQGIQQERI